MTHQQEYVNEKLRQAAAERTRFQRAVDHLPPERTPRTRPVWGAVARLAGHRLRRAGEALESWAMRQPARG